MKKIIIKSIDLLNFKGIRKMTLNFYPTHTRISGANRTGKTTIADAINWCLFGKDSKSRAQFGIKTRVNGVEIPHIDHFVVLAMEIDGVSHIFQRCFVEQWVKQRGTTESVLKGHTTECYIDGQKYTLKDYQNYISNIVSEDIFKLLTTPVCFTSMAWEEQRRLLGQMCPDISEQDIYKAMNVTDEDEGILKLLIQALRQKTIEEHRKHLSYVCKQIKSKLDEIPSRIEEVNMMTPKKEAWENIEEKIKAKEDEINELRRDKESGSRLSEVKRITSAIEFAEKRKLNIEQSARNKETESRNDADSEIRDRNHKINSYKMDIESLKLKNNSFNAIIENLEESLPELDKKAQQIRDAWAENTNKRFTLSEDLVYCPTCGQPLPQEKLTELMNERKAEFNKQKSRRYQQLTDEANKLKKLIADTKNEIASYKNQMDYSNEGIKEYETKIKELEEAEQKPILTANELLLNNDNYQKILKEIIKLRIELDSVSQAGDEEYKTRLKTLGEEVSELQDMLSKKKSYDKLQVRLGELNDQQRELNEQLSGIERQQDMAELYQSTADNLFEREINKKFGFVQFRLFRTLVNGDRLPYCEATVGGVPFSDLNTADKINAGVDIINVFSRHFDVSAPIIIDNAEAINKILDTQSQTVRLYVSEEERLRVSCD